MSYGQFSNIDSSSTDHVNSNKVYVVVTHVIMDIVDVCIDCGIESSFNKFQCVIELS